MSSGSSRNGTTILGPNPTKACVNCRRQKMKCEVDPDRTSSCRRCRLSKTPCIFKPRANAAIVHEVPETRPAVGSPGSSTSQPRLDSQTVLNRLDKIESLLGISSSQPVADDDVASQSLDAESPFRGVWEAAVHLKLITKPPQASNIWSREVIQQLWLAFHKNQPGLHFLSKKKTSSTPTPLLLSSILYVSALHHQSPDYASLAPAYFAATCCAISELALPAQTPPQPDKVEQKAFQNVLGLILAGLISEAFIDTAGLWITMGYRLTLDHCPVHIDERSYEWRGLFSGLQIIDLEHASLHMSCPIVPREAPLPSLRQLQRSTEDPFYPLTQLMHTGLSHFTGRGLPTIWSFICSDPIPGSRRPPSSLVFTEIDSKLIREWARQLDNWLVTWNKPNDPDLDTLMIFRQYSLHRLFVLSIYHPARGFDLFANTVATAERHELLISARSTLKLQNEDKGIWSNWDLVMITWAALIVLQGIEGGVGEPNDFILIQAHLNMLSCTHQPEPSLRHKLASRLESSLQNMHTPRPTPDQDAMMDIASGLDPSWAIFDQNSINLANQQLAMGRPLEPTGTTVTQQSNGNQDAQLQIQAGSFQTSMADAGMGGGRQEGYVEGMNLQGQQWTSNEQYSDAWQSTLFRLFGSSDLPLADGGLL